MQAISAVSLSPRAEFQLPLSKHGVGPGLILLVDQCSNGMNAAAHSLDPQPLQKWAEEGYAVVQIKTSADQGSSLADFQMALKILDQDESCSSAPGYGLICQ